MTRTGLKPEWLLNLCKGKSPGVILIDGDNEKTPCLDFACEIRETMLELGAAKRLCVWSWQASPRMNGRILVGDSTVDTHCWTITRDVDNLPPSLKPLAVALIEDPANPDILDPIKRCIHDAAGMDAGSIEEAGEHAGDVTVVEHSQGIGLEDLARLNRAVKEAGRTFVVASELTDSRGKSYNAASYGELALRIGIEQGIDLAECAECVIALREEDSGQWRNGFPGRTLCRPLKIWNDDRCGGEFVIERNRQGRFNFKEKQGQ